MPLSREHLLKNSLLEFYKKDNNLDIFVGVLHHQDQLSLRRIERYVSKDALAYNICFIDKAGYIFRVYNEYKTQQNAYTKRFFDPFCRYERIRLDYTSGKLETTIGQLNFFRWAIVNDVLANMRKSIKSRSYSKVYLDLPTRLDFD